MHLAAVLLRLDGGRWIKLGLRLPHLQDASMHCWSFVIVLDALQAFILFYAQRVSLLAGVTSARDAFSMPDARMACFLSAAQRYAERLCNVEARHLETSRAREIHGHRVIDGGEVQKFGLEVSGSS